VFRGLTGDAVHLELSRCFGPLMAHPVRENRAVGAAELTPIHFRPQDGYLQEVDGELARGVPALALRHDLSGQDQPRRNPCGR